MRAFATTTPRFTLEVFDEQLVHAGAELVRGRLRLLERLVPAVAAAYEMLALDAAPDHRHLRERIVARRR